MGYVYVIEAGDFCKIGISDKSVEQRMRSLQTGCPVKFERVWCSRNIPDELECERELHNYFREFKSSGEWFKIPFIKAAEKADEVCRNGPDLIRIKSLEAENAQLKALLKDSYTKDEIVNAIIGALNTNRN